MEVDWIVFDAVGTVIRAEPSVAVAYHAIGREFGSALSVEEVRSRFTAAFAETERRDLASSGRLTTNPAVEEARWRYVVQAVFPEIEDQEGCFQELHDYFALPSAWQLFDDAVTALRNLSNAGIQLAIASNFDHRLHSICDGTPELNCFSRRFISSELGFRKPSEHFYRSILADLNHASSRVMMIGDSLENDVEGALAVGINAALVDRDVSRTGTDGDSAATSTDDRYCVVKSLNELERLLT